jgi:hypothetical protein
MTVMFKDQRNTLKEVYTAIENDLLFAKLQSLILQNLELLWLLHVLLARFICIKSFPEAATAANAVIGTSGISFCITLSTITQVLSISSSKMLLEIMVLPSHFKFV